MQSIIAIFIISAPLLFATLGALITEYTGAMAIFMDGLINLSAFLFMAFTIVTGSQFLGFIFSSLVTITFIFFIALFTFKTKANPFLTGLAVNLLSQGFISVATTLVFNSSATIAFSTFYPTKDLINLNNGIPTILAIFISIAIFVFIRFSRVGMNLRYAGEGEKALFVRGVNKEKYIIITWTIAGGFATISGSIIASSLGAYTPNISASTGWTALATVFLAHKHPLLCIPATLLFASTGYYTNMLQANSVIPAGIVLALPYGIALTVFVVTGVIAKSLPKD